MKLGNPLEMNDWRIRSFLLFSFSALALLWITFILNSSGFQIPLVQQVAGCICLLFVPGIAVLRILRLHKLGSVETPLYAIGISISVVMFAGLLLNMLAPPVGIRDPLSTFHLILVFSGIIVALCIASYIRDKDFAAPTRPPIDTLSPRLLSLLLLPFLGIFGAYLVNYYESNWLILLMFIAIGIVVLAVSLRNQVGGSTYALAIFVISLSLLLSNALISRYLWGWDVFGEANVANQVINNAVWNPAYNAVYTSALGQAVTQYNSVLSTTIFAPILSKIANIDISSLFKIVYPVLYALVPVALYELFRKQTSDIVAFLSSFFFVTVLTFSMEMLSLPREELGELFLVLVLLLIFDKTFPLRTKSSLLILFSASMIVSHYGIAFVFMVQLILVFILLLIADSGFLNHVKRKLISNPASESTTTGFANSRVRKETAITGTFVLMFAAMTLTWYIVVGTGLLFTSFVHTLGNTLSADFISSASIQTGAKLQSPPTLLIAIADRLNTCATLLVFLGVAVAFVRPKQLRFEREYLAFALTGCGLVLLTFALPVFFLTWNAGRLQALSLVIMAPFCVIGILTLCRVPRLITQAGGGSFEPGRKSYAVASVFLVLLLLLNTGFVYALAGQPATYPAPALFNEQDSLLFLHAPDLAGAKWLGSVVGAGSVYGANYSVHALFAYSNVSVDKIQQLPYPAIQKNTTYYIYVRSSDIASMATSGENSQQLSESGLPSTQYTDTLNKIYDSGSVIYTT